MLKKALYALLVAIVVATVCILLGELLVLFEVAIANSIGEFLKENSTLIGILGGLVYFVSDRPWLRQP